MKRVAVLLGLGVFLTFSCSKSGQEFQCSDVSFTPCQQTKATKSGLSDKVDVEFTNEGVRISYRDFAVTCNFTTVDVTHTFVNGVLSITQQGSPNQANCICYTDVSYTINGISQNEVNVIFINGEQVYCHNEDNQSHCDQDVIIYSIEYQDAPNEHFVVENMRIEGNCLKIRFSASGCDGSAWDVKLIASLGRGAGNPFWSLLLSLETNEDCRALITKEMSFNIEDLQLLGKNNVRLHIVGTEHSILYEY